MTTSQEDASETREASDAKSDPEALVEAFCVDVARVEDEIHKRIVGQDDTLRGVLTCLLAGGHALLEGVPGLGKTLMVRTLADVLDLRFNRIQFTPDLMPADIVGTNVLTEAVDGAHRVEFREGPVFANVVLADEVNRATPKTQSALLEVMQEHSVTVSGRTRKMDEPYLVLATQNPLEMEGTYPLPEAQLDRFLMHVTVDYPEVAAERQILALARREAGATPATPARVVSVAEILAARQATLTIHMAPSVEEYIVQLVMATRTPGHYSESLASWLEYGGSPRATIALDRCARALAWLHGRDYVSPDDVQAVIHDILRHRLILSFEAEANGITKDQVIDTLLAHVPVT